MTKKISILLIGYDSNLCLGVLYCLKSLQCNVYLLTHNKKNAARFSRFLKKFYYEHDKTGTYRIEEIVKAHHIDLIMPIDELEIRSVKENEEKLSEIAKCTWATDIEMFNIGINKRKLAKFLTENKIPCPPFAVLDNLTELKDKAAAMTYPVLIKPDRGAFGRMIRRFENWEQLKEFYIENESEIKNYIVQPFIIGSDVTCNVICKKGEIICYTIQESPVKTGSDFSSNDILDFHDDAQVIAVIAKMMKLLQWHGVACIDLRRDIRDNSINVLEINGRFWASVISSYSRTGLNFPIIMSNLAMGNDIGQIEAKPGKQLTIRQVFSTMFTKNSGSFKDTKYISYFADPLARTAQYLKL